MNSIMAKVALPALRRMDAERAHQIALAGARVGIAGHAEPDSPRLAARLLGIDLANPIGLAAGFDKDAVALRGLAAAGFGFLEAGTVTLRAQPGNPRPRLFRLEEDGAVINRMGFNNSGIEAFCRRLDTSRPTLPLGVNIGLNKTGADPAHDYPRLVAAVAGKVAYVAINVSSPNTPGLRDLQAPHHLAALLGAIHRHVASPPPLFVKLAPDLADAALADIVAACLDHGTAGLIVCNTTVARPQSLGSRHAGEAGGLSGAPLKARAAAMLRAVARLGRGQLALIGVGGIATGADVLDRLRDGASAVQLYTALTLHGPALLPRLKRELLAALDGADLADVAMAVGSGL